MQRLRLLLTRTSWGAPLDLVQPILGLFHKHPFQNAVALRTAQEIMGPNTCRCWRLAIGGRSLQCKWRLAVHVIDQLWKARKLHLIKGFLICKQQDISGLYSDRYRMITNLGARVLRLWLAITWARSIELAPRPVATSSPLSPDHGSGRLRTAGLHVAHSPARCPPSIGW